MKLSKKIYLILLFVCSLVPSLAYADRILDKVEVIQAKTETEIHIEFATQVRYVRHSPSNKQTSRVQIFLEFPQVPRGSLSSQREFRNSPSVGQIPSFTVNYPEQQVGSVGIRFKKPIKFTISPDNSGRGIVIRVPLDKSLPTDIVTVTQAQPAIEHGPQGELPVRAVGMSDSDYASQLLSQAKSARGAGDYPRAVELLNAILNLPANPSSQDAQELIGNSREKMGESDKAKAEYETYLKLYPKGEGATRVSKRLAAISGSAQVASTDKAKTKKPIGEIHENTISGSWDQYYYDGHTHSYNNDGKRSTSHDLSQLETAIDLTARFRQNEWDNKIVIRDRFRSNFLPNQVDRNRLQAAYVEINNKEADYSARLGRQNGNSGGILGRFDGAWFRYGLSPQYRLNFALGTLDEYKVDYRRHFYGINLDVGPFLTNWKGNAFYINQRVGDIKDREAVGGELSYSNGGRSVYSLVDYDTMFSKVNTVMVQGNWLTESGINYNILLDHRKSPILTMINSLSDPAFQNTTYFSKIPTNLRQALLIGRNIPAPLTVTEDKLRQYAYNQALDTNLALFGVTKQFTQRWQLGGDVQWSRVSG
ncbi:MAG: tetratricopeptide repeat protein, partial [Methylotenera sp.]